MARNLRRPSPRDSKMIHASAALMDSLEIRRLLSASKIAGAVRTTTLVDNAIRKVTVVPASKRIPLSDIRSAKHPSADLAYTQYQYGPADGITPSIVGPLKPNEIRAAYGMNTITFGGVAGDGTGQTIAIIDAYDNPAFVSSTNANFNNSDLHRFDFDTAVLGTSGRINVDPPSFVKVNQRGGTSYPTFDAGWSGEIALDVEWAHVMAPKASIVLVEADSNGGDDLLAAVNYAKNLAGVTAISMSYGGAEDSSELSEESSYIKTGVSFLASTGDDGSPGGYPAYSANVVAVGGTTIDHTGSVYSETGWSDSGGGISQYIAKPNYQQLITTPSSTARTIPDVSADANPDSGVYLLNNAQAVHDANGSLATQQTATWYQAGGTSLSAPLWAGIVSVANQGRVKEGLATFATSQNLLTRLYTLPGTDYNDIPAGVSNGLFSTDTGYDLVTGRGSPKASLVYHVAGGNIGGTLFIDADGDAVFDSGETAVAGVSVYLDANNNGVQDSGEATATTTAAGAYSFSDLVGGFSYAVRLAATAASTYLTTAGTTVSTLVNYGTNSGLNIGLFPRSITAAALTATLDSTGSIEEIFTNATGSGSPTYSIARSILSTSSFTINGTSAADLFTIDLSNGSPLTTAGITLASTTAADTLNIIGSAFTDLITLNAGAIVAGSGTLNYTALGAINIASSDGPDQITVNALLASTTLTIDPGLGADVITIGGATGNTDAVAGAIAIPQANASDAIVFNDSNSTVAHTYTLSGNATSGTFTRSVSGGVLTFGAGVRFDLSPGKGDDLIAVTPSAAAKLNVFADAALATDNDRLRVSAAVNSGFTFTPSDTESGTYAFADGSLPITFTGVERNAPLAVTAAFDYAGLAPAIVIAFTSDVSASLVSGDLTINDVTHGTSVAATFTSYDAATNTARFAVSNLADANYTATLAATGVGSAAGDALVLDAAFGFFSLAGDINHDRVVNFDDLIILAQNYNATGKTFAQGNINYSADGNVNFDDLVILAQNYNKTLAASPLMAAVAMTPATASTVKKTTSAASQLSELA